MCLRAGRTLSSRMVSSRFTRDLIAPKAEAAVTRAVPAK
jgi:hypothetical protein